MKLDKLIDEVLEKSAKHKEYFDKNGTDVGTHSYLACAGWRNSSVELAKACKRLKEALEFYSREHNYHLGECGCKLCVHSDKGKIARAALSEVEK